MSPLKPGMYICHPNYNGIVKLGPSGDETGEWHEGGWRQVEVADTAPGRIQASTGQMPAAKIRARIAELEKVRENYIGYLAFRKSEADWHGCWDASVNISETECEIAGLKFALDAMEAG